MRAGLDARYYGARVRRRRAAADRPLSEGRPPRRARAARACGRASRTEGRLRSHARRPIRASPEEPAMPPLPRPLRVCQAGELKRLTSACSWFLPPASDASVVQVMNSGARHAKRSESMRTERAWDSTAFGAKATDVPGRVGFRSCRERHLAAASAGDGVGNPDDSTCSFLGSWVRARKASAAGA